MIRRHGASPDPARHYRVRPGAYAILRRDGHFLATVQADPGPEVQLPGGGIDPGESPQVALHREVIEETGWTISTPRRVGMFRRFVYMPEYDLYAEKLCSVWLARPILRLSPPTEPGHSAVWLTPAELLVALADPGSRAIFGHWLRTEG
ncbi:NUDIX domain-containing protein [Paracoccus pacificus]|uniref:NUDIX domain-containing protein n=1 Tax=Paracoccus pacificus TaxID=1463598 RepID=A0ABW4RAA7_9RHOB